MRTQGGLVTARFSGCKGGVDGTSMMVGFMAGLGYV